MEMDVSHPAIVIIKELETLQLEAYEDGASVSIGYGHSNLSGGEQFDMGDVITEDKAEQLLKEDLKDFNGLDIISKLKVYNFNWIGEDRRDHGLLAHEVQEVLPDLVSGEKDGVLENGKIDKQTLDYGRFTPMLIKAVQEQQAVIEDLKARIEVLEG